MKKTTLKISGNAVAVPLNFGNGSEVNHAIYGKGKCVGFVQGEYWRIEFKTPTNGQYVRDFLPSKLFASLV